MDAISLVAVAAFEIEDTRFGDFFDFKFSMVDDWIGAPKLGDGFIKVENRFWVAGLRDICLPVEWLTSVIA